MTALAAIACGFLVFATSVGAAISAPNDPPQQWNLTLRFDASKDVAEQLVTFQKTDEFASSYGGPLYLSIEDDGLVRGNEKHPFITGKADSSQLGVSDSKIAVVSKHDLALLYTNVLNAIAEFPFTNVFAYTNYDSPGVNLSIELHINGRFQSIRYENLQISEPLPGTIRDLLAVARRNLPQNYSRFFQLLGVPQLEPLSGKPVAQVRKCHLHDIPMHVGTVRIAYGKESYSKSFRAAQQSLFPNANTESSGGCIVFDDSPNQTELSFCPRCREAKERWQAENNEVFRAPPDEK